MDAFEVYRYYIALKLHFTTDKYDVVKSQGRVKVTRNAFLKRKDLGAISRVAKNYSDEEVVNFLVANFVSGDRWGGLFDTEAKERYVEWKRRIESLRYTFEQDLDKVFYELESENKTFEHLFYCAKGEHPYIIKAYLRKTITIETLVILDRLLNFIEQFDNDIEDTIVYPDISRLVKKYKPFLKFDLEKFNGILRSRT